VNKMLEKVIRKEAKTEAENEYRTSNYTLNLSCDTIEFEIAAGEEYQGSFSIVTDDKARPEGYVYSEDIRLYIRTPEFGGLNKEIVFFYDSTGLKDGSVIKGNISIVSNLGEVELPYVVHISSGNLSSSLGEVRNLFHFANLAKTDWNQAVSLFYSPGFINILSGNDKQYIEYYRGLSVLTEGEDGELYANESNVNTFLELTRKKSRIKYIAETKVVDIKNPKETYYTEVQIRRDGWGYTNLAIDADQEFVIIEKDFLMSEDFDENDIATIPVYIDVNGIHRGINTAKITLRGFYENLEIPVTVTVNTGRIYRDGFRSDKLGLMKYYVAYRIGRISKNEWVKESGVIVSHMLSEAKTSDKSPADEKAIEQFVVAKLYQVQLFLTQKRDNDARGALEHAKLFLNEATAPEIIGYSLYLEYLMTKEDTIRNEFAKNIELLYVQNKNCMPLAWMLLYVKEELQRNDKERIRLLREQYENGCISPLLYVEALNVFIQTPSLINQLTDFELAIFNFAKKQAGMTGELRSRLNFVAAKEITYSREIYDLLVYSYEKEPRTETLEEICKMLMRGNRIGPDCFTWYEKAVENELRISRLYEYYIMSIDLAYTGRLPKIILMYFAYRSELDYERNAFLYANVLRHKPAYQDIYKDYLPAIKEFALEQLKKCRVNENLVYIYKNVLGESLYQEELVPYYAQILFSHYVEIKNPKKDSEITAIIVVNEHLAEEQSYPVYNNHTIIPLVGNDYCILVEDEYGNRYVDSSLYKVKRIIKTDSRVEEVMMKNCADLYPAMYLADKAYGNSDITPEEEAALIFLTECDQIVPEYQLGIMMNLAENYFDKDEITRLDELMLRFDPEVLDGEMREKCVHIMVARGMYDRALEWVCKYGTEYIDDKILVRLCDRVLVRSDYEYEYSVLKICESVFLNGRYDETILNYMLIYKNGSSKSLKRLWRAADSFNLDVHGLLENMIVQLLYSGASIGEEANIFLQYVTENPSLEIEKLFLDRLSYDYFVRKLPMDREVFDTVITLHQMGENLTDYVKIAFLKSCAETREKIVLSSEQKALIVLFMNEFSARHIMFPFFLEFRDFWPKLAMYEDRCFVEYTGDPESKVVLHYCIENKDEECGEFQREEMQHLLGGVFVKNFVLFSGENLRYYITEEGFRSEKLTQSSTLKSASKKNNTEHKYAYINNIAKARAANDNDKFLKLSEEYIAKQYITEKLFLPDRGEK